ncbi:hypothetical protein GCM10009430_41880 [Aquimarina litoralis]|uniref:Tetratricopeptide repeat protein n=1 Tax=Aquimarina litoralis TaxID=584605 RepID=A0ABP3UHW6_9FLAO
MKTYIITVALILNLSFVFSQEILSEAYLDGNEYFRMGEYQKAIKSYTKLISMDNKKIRKTGYVNRGLARDKIKEYDGAIQDFTEAIKLDSTDMASFIDRGLSKMHAGYFAEAIKDYEYVIHVNTDSKMVQNAIYWMARINFSQGKFDEVVRNCDDYFKVNSIDAELYFIRGTANDMLGNFEQSIKDYSKAIKLYPNYYQAYANRGTAKINLLTGKGNLEPSRGETKNACRDLKKALEMGDNSVEDLIYVYCSKK